MRLTKSSGMKKSWSSSKTALVKRLARVKNSAHLTWNDGQTTICVVAVGVAAAVMLNAALRPHQPVDDAAANAPPKAAPAPVQAAKAPAATMSNRRPEPSAAKPSVQQAMVTITGCLELDKEAFRLKDTTGVGAPKARSWKSGFLRKNTASIAVVDSANRVKLPSHVGERVIVTGMLVDREMQVRSLRRVAASCKQEA